MEDEDKLNVDIKISDILLGNIRIQQRSLLKNFFKKLNTYLKFKIFSIWTYRNFYIEHPKTFNDFYEIYKLRYSVYCEEYNYLDAEKYPNKAESDGYDNYSEHFLLKTRKNYENGNGNNIVGYVRLILFSERSFPVLKHFKLFNNYNKIDLIKSAEISRLIISSDFRKFHLLLLLIKAMYKYVKEKNIKYIFGVMDDRLIKVLLKMGMPFRQVGEYTHYQGCTRPNILVVKEMEDELIKKNKLLFKFFKNEKI